LRNQKVLLELVWWLITAAIVCLVLFPIVQVTDHFPFTKINVLFIATFITMARYLFLLKYSLWGRFQYLKLFLIFLSIPFVFYLSNELNDFLGYLDEETLDGVLGHLPPDRQASMDRYIRSEMIFFGVSSIITAVILPFRLVISIWRLRNRGTL